MRQMLQDIFEQAEWRQPSVVLLDDLDHVTGAPTSAEHEHGPEALIQLHIAQSKPLLLYFMSVHVVIKMITGVEGESSCVFAAAGLKDVVDEVMVHSSLVCLIITSQSEHSLHPSLTEVQGSHFIQGFAHIQPPDQVGTAIHTQTCTLVKVRSTKLTAILFDFVCRLREQKSCCV